MNKLFETNISFEERTNTQANTIDNPFDSN